VGIVISLCPSLSQQKYFIRLGAKHMDHLPLCLINAHFAIMSGTYRQVCSCRVYELFQAVALRPVH
jgi:hypothetical protein